MQRGKQYLMSCEIPLSLAWVVVLQVCGHHHFNGLHSFSVLLLFFGIKFFFESLLTKQVEWSQSHVVLGIDDKWK